MVNGYYNSAVLEKLNWFLRDWQLNESTKMDPKLFDIIWQVYRQFPDRSSRWMSYRAIDRRRPTPCCVAVRGRWRNIPSIWKAARSTRIS